MPDDNNEPSAAPQKADPFLLAEYDTLTKIEISRNERLDRFITLFLTVAGAPFAVYSLTVGKDGRADLLSMPNLIACLFLLASVLGFLVVMIIIQVRFNIILYVRAANAIRGHFAAKSDIEKALLLPKDPRVPPYYEGGKHTQQTIIAMALVNSLFLGLAAYNLIATLSLWQFRIVPSGIATLIFFYVHLGYYRRSAKQREHRDRGPGQLHFLDPKEHEAKPAKAKKR